MFLPLHGKRLVALLETSIVCLNSLLCLLQREQSWVLSVSVCMCETVAESLPPTSLFWLGILNTSWTNVFISSIPTAEPIMLELSDSKFLNTSLGGIYNTGFWYPSLCGRGCLKAAYSGKPLHTLCLCVVIVCRHLYWSLCSYLGAHLCILCFSAVFSSSEETPFRVQQDKHLSAQPWHSSSCVWNEPHVCVLCENVHFTPVCAHKLKPVYRFPLWPACLWYQDTSVARGLADVGANAARLFTLNHVGTLQTPCCCCCCSYGLVSSSYWLLVKLKAGERLIKDTLVCVARQGPVCGFYWLAGLINTGSRRESLLAAMYCLLHDAGV